MNFPYNCVDLTHPLTSSTPSWDSSCGYSHSTSLDYIDCATEVKFRVQNITMPAGIDTLGPDTAESGYPVHQIMLSHGKYLVENVANADLLPSLGITILVAPLYIVGGTEAPIRLIGFI